MRRAVRPAIPPKMYRHFAVVTVLLTAFLAIFASGESRTAVAAHVEEQARDNAVRRESYAKFGTPKLGVSAAPSAGAFVDDGVEFGKPMDNPSGGIASSLFARADAPEAAGYSPEYLASLSPEERELLLKGLEDNGLMSDEVRIERGEALAAASARRSGTPGGGD